MLTSSIYSVFNFYLIELIHLIENFLQFKRLQAIFYAFIFTFGSISGLRAEESSRIFQKIVYNVLHKQLKNHYEKRIRSNSR